MIYDFVRRFAPLCCAPLFALSNLLLNWRSRRRGIGLTSLTTERNERRLAHMGVLSLEVVVYEAEAYAITHRGQQRRKLSVRPTLRACGYLPASDASLRRW